MFNKMEPAEVEQLIHQQLICRLAGHADGQTYIVPISYAYDGEYIYVRTFEGKKLDMFRKNPKLCFQIDDTRNLSNWKSVIAWGDFEEMKTESEKEIAIGHLMARNIPVNSSETMHISPEWPFMPDHTNKISGVFFKVRLMGKTGRYEVSAAQLFAGT